LITVSQNILTYALRYAIDDAFGSDVTSPIMVEVCATIGGNIDRLQPEYLRKLLSIAEYGANDLNHVILEADCGELEYIVSLLKEKLGEQ
jgi:hypothetical protein